MRIGVFDSGIGGLTVLREIQRRLPRHSTVYLGDTARVPYGTKSPQTIRRYARLNAEFLLGQGIEFLVIACNTASAFALEELAALPVPVVGVIEPGAELAVRLARGGKIGVLGTPGTVRSGAYERAIHRLDSALAVESIACPLFVPLVEEGWEETEIAAQAARAYLAPWLAGAGGKPQTVILGCTHYPLLKPTIQKALGNETTLVDSAEAVASHVESKLIGAREETEPSRKIFLTDASESFIRFAQNFLGGSPSSEESGIEIVDLDLSATL